MSTGPDLFVICKNCGSEVSPYVTECPYCGTRVRKRAPKIERAGAGSTPSPAGGAAQRAPRPRRRTDAGRRPSQPTREPRGGRPWATIVLVVVPVLVTLVWRAGGFGGEELALVGALGADWWRLLTAPLLYLSTGHEVIALGAVALFGWLLERRHGPLAPLLVGLIGGAAGMALASTTSAEAFATGGHGVALALLGAWAVPDLLARRQPDADGVETDLIGVLAIAGILLAIPLADVAANFWSGIGGLLTGVLLGFPLARR